MAKPGSNIFADPEELFSNVRSAAAFTSMLAASGDSLPNDAEVRETLSPGIEPLLYVLDQLLAPTRDEADAIIALRACADARARQRARETAAIAAGAAAHEAA